MTLLPGAQYDPGRHWNYEAGWSSCLTVVQHYTVGTDSRAIIRNGGLAAILVWDDVIWEFGPLDAVHFTQCEWNRRSIGIEVESLDGSLTPGQIANLGYVVLYCLTQWGIPDVFYDGPRMPVGYDYRGVTNHRNLVHNACDMHSDGFDQWVWDAYHAPAPSPTEARRHNGMTIGLFDTTYFGTPGIAAYLLSGDGFIVHEFSGPPNAYGIKQDASDFNEATHCGFFWLTAGEWVRSLKKSGLVAA